LSLGAIDFELSLLNLSLSDIFENNCAIAPVHVA